jgi:hypothetical protein
MGHVALLGDSIFDNARYVGKRPAVIDQLRAALPGGWNADLYAVDGEFTRSVPKQLHHVPASATHLVISAGGNDALGKTGVLSQDAGTVGEALLILAAAGAEFERDYRAMVAIVTERRLPVVLSTIYNPRFGDTMFQEVAVTALCMFNDAILRAAFEARLPVIDLRLICTDASHYANDIEPSSAGGERIAAVIARVVTTHDFSSGRSAIYW